MNTVTERRSESLDKLHNLLQTRVETLTLYNQVAALRPFEEAKEDLPQVLREFCETLMDYTASAHFQLYRFIEDGSERRAKVVKVAENLYPGIADSTQSILDFNDKYDADHELDHLASLDSDLSRLGEILADRIQDEDQIITAFSAYAR